MTAERIVILDYSRELGSVGLGFSQNVYEDLFKGLEKIRGIDYCSAGLQSVTIYLRPACVWSVKIASQVIATLAQRMDFDPEALSLEHASTPKVDTSIDLGEVLDAVKQLRRSQFVPAPQNPLCPFAFTEDDVRPDTPFITYSMSIGIIDEGLFVDAPFDKQYGQVTYKKATVVFTYYNGEKSVPEELSLEGMGISTRSLPPGTWHPTNFAVANTPEGRRQFVAWLISLQSEVAHKAALNLVEKNLTDYMDPAQTGGSVTLGSNEKGRPQVTITV